MGNYTISYHSVNTYSSKIHEAVLEFLVIPSAYEGYVLEDYDINSTPRTKFYLSKNLNGFQVIKYRITQPLTEFEFNFKARVSMTNKALFEPKSDMTILSSWKTLQSHSFKINYLNYLHQTYYTKLTQSEITLPQPNYDKPVLSYGLTIMRFVHDVIEFKIGETNTATTASDVLRIRKGVCQDFTHLFLSLMRQTGIPARYVSGYLNQGGDFRGSAFMHAWAEIMIPELGWTGFDPTNNLLADNNYLKVSHGSDYSECSTLKGVIRSSGTNKTQYDVQVIEQ
jgi:transglutaminase-like putative cysteine protease